MKFSICLYVCTEITCIYTQYWSWNNFAYIRTSLFTENLPIHINVWVLSTTNCVCYAFISNVQFIFIITTQTSLIHQKSSANVKRVKCMLFPIHLKTDWRTDTKLLSVQPMPNIPYAAQSEKILNKTVKNILRRVRAICEWKQWTELRMHIFDSINE